MRLTIELPPAVQAQLHEEARRRGLDAGSLAAHWLAGHLGTAGAPKGGTLSGEEGALLQEINLGFSDSFRTRYREFGRARRDETLTEAEQAELISVSDRFEAANVRRMALPSGLALLRGVTIRELMEQLDISPGSPVRASALRGGPEGCRRASAGLLRVLRQSSSVSGRK